MKFLDVDGVIGAVGVSTYSLDRWRKADAALGRPVISNQVHFSLAHPGPLDDLVPFAERDNRMVMAYGPLFGTENLKRVEPLPNTVVKEVDAKPAQVALAWLIRLPGAVAIPGASSVEQLESNVATADLDLSADHRNALTAAARAFRPVSIARLAADTHREKLGR